MVPSHLHVVMSSSPVRSCSSVCMELDILRYHKLYVLHPVFPSVFVHYVALADLKLIMYVTLTWKLYRPTGLCFLRAEIKGMCHHGSL